VDTFVQNVDSYPEQCSTAFHKTTVLYPLPQEPKISEKLLCAFMVFNNFVSKESGK
jgi:hypothetical protein